MRLGQIPTMMPGMAMQTALLYVMQKNTKLAGMITATYKNPKYDGGFRQRIKNIQWIKGKALSAIPKGKYYDQVKKGYDKMAFTMSVPTTLMSTPPSAFAKELDKINSILSSLAAMNKQKATAVIERAAEKANLPAKDIEMTKAGSREMAAARKKPAKLPAKPEKKKMSKLVKAGIITAGSLAALFAAWGIYLAAKGK